MTQRLRENTFTRFRKNVKSNNKDKLVECLGIFFDEAYLQDDLSGQTFDDVVAKIHEVDPDADAVATAKVFFESVKAEKNAQLNWKSASHKEEFPGSNPGAFKQTYIEIVSSRELGTATLNKDLYYFMRKRNNPRK